jgi:hypothetical protein
MRHAAIAVASAALVVALAVVPLAVIGEWVPPARARARHLTWVPPVYNQTVIDAFKNKTLLNPFPVPPSSWNPYVNATNTTWPDTVCAVVYPYEPDRSRYALRTFPTAEAARAAGAFVTHLHPCGLCSTTVDLAVYMAYPDLTTPGRECGLVSILSPQLGRDCFQKIGFTAPCAAIWYRDAQHTRENCFAVCIKDWIEKVPNNVPPNSTILNPCLQCDEDKSGPVFKRVAGRTRRDSGIASAIRRPPSSVYHVTHYYY